MPGEEANETKAQKLAAARKKVKTLMTRHTDKSLNVISQFMLKCVCLCCAVGDLGVVFIDLCNKKELICS